MECSRHAAACPSLRHVPSLAPDLRLFTYTGMRPSPAITKRTRASPQAFFTLFARLPGAQGAASTTPLGRWCLRCVHVQNVAPAHHVMHVRFPTTNTNTNIVAIVIHLYSNKGMRIDTASVGNCGGPAPKPRVDLPRATSPRPSKVRKANLSALAQPSSALCMGAR